MHCRDFTRQSVAAFVKGIQRLNFIFLVLVLLAASLPRCKGGGMFQVQFLDYENPGQRDAENRCCIGDFDSQGSCVLPCRTFFTVCLQPQSNQRCVFGQASSELLGNGSFVIPTTSLLQGPLTSWPRTFAVVISAMHLPGGNSSAVLIEKVTINKGFLIPNAQWTNVTHNGTVARLRFSYRFLCQKDYYGSSCSTICIPRNDSLGHWICDSSGRRVCLPGWSGATCLTALCRVGCHPQRGSCRRPNECQCKAGWQGPNCTQCQPDPHCVHGTCSNREFECNCNPGWGGPYCDQDLEYCARNKPCKNGASCINKQGSFECICPKGYTGRQCNIEIDECSSNPCKNGGNCTDLIGDFNCTCPEGYGGKQCLPECLPSTCLNGGTCFRGIRGLFCTCKVGFTGNSCEAVVWAASPSSNTTDETSTHPASTKQIITNGTTVEPTTGIPSTNQTSGGNDERRGPGSTRRTTMIVAIVVSVIVVLILIAACVAWKFWRKHRRESADHVTEGAVESGQIRNPKQIDIEDADPKHCAGARSGNPEIIRNFTSSKQPVKNTNEKQEHLEEKERKLKSVPLQENARTSLELSDITTTTTTTIRKTTRMNLDELYLPNRCYDQGFWQEVDLEI